MSNPIVPDDYSSWTEFVLELASRQLLHPSALRPPRQFTRERWADTVIEECRKELKMLQAFPSPAPAPVKAEPLSYEYEVREIKFERWRSSFAEELSTHTVDGWRLAAILHGDEVLLERVCAPPKAPE